MNRSLRVVVYAVNGTGLGHLTRLVAIARWVRRYASVAGVNAEIYFLTSSESEGLLFQERFASFKLPSKTVVGDAGIDRTAYLALAKQWVWHSIGLLRPDLFVVDTFPRGSFGELLGALDLCKKKAFVYRPTKDAFASRADFQAMLPLYDLLLVPENEGDADVIVPESARPRVRYVGPIASCSAAEIVSREAARAWFGVPESCTCIYVSAGGGGDPNAESQLHAIANALANDSSLHLVIGAGPLYRGRPIYGERISFVMNAGIAARASAFDFAISAAGYNTVTELLQAGIPLLLLPQEKVADDQAARAARIERISRPKGFRARRRGATRLTERTLSKIHRATPSRIDLGGSGGCGGCGGSKGLGGGGGGASVALLALDAPVTLVASTLTGGAPGNGGSGGAGGLAQATFGFAGNKGGAACNGGNGGLGGNGGNGGGGAGGVSAGIIYKGTIPSYAGDSTVTASTTTATKGLGAGASNDGIAGMSNATVQAP